MFSIETISNLGPLQRMSRMTSGHRVSRFSTRSRRFLKFYNIICGMFAILNWRGLLIIPRNDFVPSETLGTVTDWAATNHSTSICNLASRHLGLLSCRRGGISELTQQDGRGKKMANLL